MRLLDWLRQRRRSEATVVIDDVGVTRTLEDGRVESVRWDALNEVWVATSSDGPWAEDVYWLLVEANGGGCAVPGSLDGAKALLARLQDLPDFDNEAVVAAMGSTADARFLCWRRPAMS